MKEQFDVAVVGAGVAGVSAALAARARGASVVVIGEARGATALVSGAWDVASDPATVDEALVADELPLKERVRRFARDHVSHPYARLGSRTQLDLERAHKLLFDAIDLYRPIVWDSPGELVATDLGLVRRVATAQRHVLALGAHQTIAVANLKGYRTVEGRFVAASLNEVFGSELARRFVPVELDFFRRRDDAMLHPHEVAEVVDAADGRDRLVAALAQANGSSAFDAFVVPCILGLHDDGALADIEQRIGKPIGELISALAGPQSLRLAHRLVRALDHAGCDRASADVAKVAFRADKNDMFELELADASPSKIAARAVVLATGKLLGGGITMHRGELSEPLAGLPIHLDGQVLSLASSPDGRDPAELFGRDPFAPNAPGFRLGVGYDASLRPLGRSREPVHGRLFAAGALLDGTSAYDGSGLGVATLTGVLAGEAAASAGSR